MRSEKHESIQTSTHLQTIRVQNSVKTRNWSLGFPLDKFISAEQIMLCHEVWFIDENLTRRSNKRKRSKFLLLYKWAAAKDMQPLQQYKWSQSLWLSWSKISLQIGKFQREEFQSWLENKQTRFTLVLLKINNNNKILMA